jgi:hypothetical protein
MQPTYLPWAGYFSLIESVDSFVLLDDVQFERRSWQSRNRVLMNGKICTLTVPVRKTARETPISEIELSVNEDWQVLHWKTLCNAYAKAPHGLALLDLLEPVYLGTRFSRLADVNQQLIEVFCRALQINTPLVCASSLRCGGVRSRHLFAICSTLGCDIYISPLGSADYLATDEFADMGSLQLSFFEFTPRRYAQLRVTEFVSRLSIVDVVANIGFVAAANYIRGKYDE